MARREVNMEMAGSSDIAFLLLSFFLMTSTMDASKGMARRLPPMPQEPVQEQDIKLKPRNVLLVKVNSNNRLSINRAPADVSELKDRVKEFITNPTDNPDLSEKKIKDIEGLGPREISEGIVSLQTDRGTSYNMYMEVQNEVMKAYSELRNEFSVSHFGKSFNELQEDQQEAAKNLFPLNISEAEPKDVSATRR